jgi:hypothetical protein
VREILARFPPEGAHGKATAASQEN